ncbi:MAG TPA: Flp family type IVb pilin [Dehalococcoidia bacterium]|nr:Flp family type IVb pilin [Dehalococcoidia bacterium]
MQLISNFVSNLLARINDVREESGQTLVEYGLIVALLSIAAIAILTTLGGDIVEVFTTVSTKLSNATP